MSPKLLNTLLVLATFAIYYVLIGPLYQGTGGVFNFGDDVTTLKKRMIGYEAALQEANQLTAEAKQKYEAYKKVSDEEKREMKIMLPQSVDTLRLLNELNTLAISSGVPLGGLIAKQQGVDNLSKTGKGVVTISFSTKTTYQKFKEFMGLLEKSMRIFSIRSVTFTAPDKDSDLITFNVILETYYLP